MKTNLKKCIYMHQKKIVVVVGVVLCFLCLSICSHVYRLLFYILHFLFLFLTYHDVFFVQLHEFH
jgi:hypothetical protein